MKRAVMMVILSMLATTAPCAEMLAARDTPSPIAYRLAGQYAHLAGSEDNALALVMALHEGAAVTLMAPDAADPEVTTIEPPTGRMGWNDVRFALVIAQDKLFRFGVRRPTGEQLQAALTGGEITRADGSVVDMEGILQMRANGLTWERIARFPVAQFAR